MTEVSDDYKVEFYKQETDTVFTVLLTFSSDELTDDILIASDNATLLPTADVYGVLSNSLEYIYAPFEITLPVDDKNGSISSKLIIDNIDQTIIGHLRSISSPVNVKIQIVLSSDPNYVERSYEGFTLSSVQYDAFTIEGNLTIDYWDLEPFPSGRFTPSGFPGLF